MLLHGFSGSAEAWPAPCVEGLAARHRVLLPDLPGHGRSPDPDRAGKDLAETVESLVALLDQAGVETAAWVGYSMGGRIALGAACLRPERVDRLVLESASPGLRTEVERARRRAADRSLATRIEEEGVAAFVDRWMAQPLFDSQRALEPERLAQERRRRMDNRARGLAESLRAVGTGAQPSLWDRLTAIGTPTLLISGGLDGKFTALAAEMADLLPRALHLTVPDAGHAVHLERPADWVRAVADFLDT